MKAKPFQLNFIQVYAPAADSEGEKIENFSKNLEDEILRAPKKVILIIMDDFNAKVRDTTGDEHIRKSVGKYVLRERNERE